MYENNSERFSRLADIIVLKKISRMPPFFSKWPPKSAKFQHCSISMKIGICGKHDILNSMSASALI